MKKPFLLFVLGVGRMSYFPWIHTSVPNNLGALLLLLLPHSARSQHMQQCHMIRQELSSPLLRLWNSTLTLKIRSVTLAGANASSSIMHYKTKFLFSMKTCQRQCCVRAYLRVCNDGAKSAVTQRTCQEKIDLNISDTLLSPSAKSQQLIWTGWV